MSDPLFVDFSGVVLTRHQFINYLHHLFCRLGVDTIKYSGHSFHVGAATSAASAGIEDHLQKPLAVGCLPATPDTSEQLHLP